jgi:hypothetical protein
LSGLSENKNGRADMQNGPREEKPGANPTIASYNASVVNFYNETGSLARFENKKMFFFYSEKML